MTLVGSLAALSNSKMAGATILKYIGPVLVALILLMGLDIVHI